VSDFNFEWNGDEVERAVMARVDQELMKLGGFLVDHMQGYAPRDTGALAAGIHDTYDFSTHTLTVVIPAPYAVYHEFGTRFIRPHPFARPSIIDAAAIWNITDVLFYLNAPSQISEPLIATATGFRLPRKQKLTAKQVSHVRKNLIPTSRNLAAKFKRRGMGFRVVGPERKPF
jgi:hypothetical protein